MMNKDEKLKNMEIFLLSVHYIFLQRDNFGDFNTLYQELKYEGEYYYRNHQMSPDRFSYLLSLVPERILEKEPWFRKSISTEERLTLPLRFLASGENQ